MTEPDPQEPTRGVPPKTIILLGAGASFGSAFRLPVMRDVLDVDALTASTFESLKLAVALYTKGRPTVDLEEFLTHIDFTRQLLNERWRVHEGVEFGQIAERARFELEEFIADRLQHGPDGSDDHISLFRRLAPGDSVISVNYDRIADDSLMVVGGAGGYGLPVHTSLLGRSYALLRSGELMAGIPAGLTTLERGNGFFLKLHGSVSWLTCPNAACSANQEIVEPYNERTEVRPHSGDPCRACGMTLHRLIVAPTLGKQFVETPRLELLWHLAYRELAAAAELVVVGLSLPPSDTRLRWLLASAYLQPERKLVVVNPDNEAVARIEYACGTSVAERYRSLDELNARWAPASASRE